MINIVISSKEKKFKERPTVLVIHGWKGPFNIDLDDDIDFAIQNMTIDENFEVVAQDSLFPFIPSYYSYELNHVADAFKNHHDVNVILVKWGAGFILSYDSYVYNLPEIAKEVASYLDEILGDNSILWKNLTIVGHSLGAHLSGYIGKNVRNGKVGTIIGLDPAGRSEFILK